MECEPADGVCSSSESKEETDGLIIDEAEKPSQKNEGSCAVMIKKEPSKELIENTDLIGHGLKSVMQNCTPKIEDDSSTKTSEMESESVVNISFNSEIKVEPNSDDDDDVVELRGKMETEYNCKVKREFPEEGVGPNNAEDGHEVVGESDETAPNGAANGHDEIDEVGPSRAANGHDIDDNDSRSETEKESSEEIVAADKEHSVQTENRVGIANRLRKIIPGQLMRFEDIYFSPTYPTGRKKRTNKASGNKISGSGKISGSSKMKRARARKYSCETCGKGFYSQDVLKSHCLRHTGGKRFTCDICGKGYSWHTSYQNHMLTHTGETPYKCSYCDKILCNKLSLQGHVMRIHNKVERTFVCDRCDRRFINKYELKYHKANHEEQRRFMCDMCGKSLSTKNDLASHRLIHTGERPFTCSLCQKGFIRKSQLEEHMRQHTDGYSYQCEICGKQYSSKRSLQRHLLIHSDTRPYKCNQCEKDFKCRSALASHKDSHLGIKRHICEYCGKAFLSEPNMHKHKKRHLGVKNEVCVLCTKAFVTKQELRAHMRSHTREPRAKKKQKTVDGSSSNCRSPVSLVVPVSSGATNNHASELAKDLKEESSSSTYVKCITENQNCNTAIVYLNTESDSSAGDDYPVSTDISTSPEKRDSLSSRVSINIKEELDSMEENGKCNSTVPPDAEEMADTSEHLVKTEKALSPIPSDNLEENQNCSAVHSENENNVNSSV